MDIITRADWGAKPPKDRPFTLDSFTAGWFWHWNGPPSKLTAGSTVKQVATFLQGVQRYHQRDMAWNDIAYSFAIDPAARVYELRGWGVAGAHTQGYNSRSMAIFFAIGEGEHPTKDMIEAAEWLMRDGLAMGYSNQLVRPHSMVADETHTSCPGDDLRAYLAGRNPAQALAAGPFKCTHPLGCAGEIQQVLSDLSDKTGLTQLDPGKVDGDAGPKTALAVHSLKNLYLQAAGIK